jgi:CRP-like cAMP-binding protein
MEVERLEFLRWLPWNGSEEEEELIELLQNTPIFADLSSSEYHKISELCYESTYQPDERIFSEGDPSSAIYLVQEGCVTLFKENADGDTVELVTVEDGDFFGELALCEGHDRTASAKAGEPSVLLGIFRQELREFIKRNSRAGIQILLNIIEVMGAHVNENNRKIESLRKTIRDLHEEDEATPSNDE